MIPFHEKKVSYDFSKKIYHYLFLLFAFLGSIQSSSLNAYSYDVDYNGVPGCWCFIHCGCFEPSLKELLERLNPSSCCSKWRPQNTVWHTYITDVMRAIHCGPVTQNYTVSNLHHLVKKGYNETAMFPDYLLRIEEVRDEIIEAHRYWVNSDEEIHKLGWIDKKEKDERICLRNAKLRSALEILDELPEKLAPLYKNILKGCYDRERSNVAFYYNSAFLNFLDRKYSSAVDDLRYIFDTPEGRRLKKNLDASSHHLCGKTFLEGGLFQDAIFHLSEAITLNPELKEAYFDRAVAYFETGDFDKSIDDYLHSKKRMSPDSYTTIPSFDIFVRGFAKGLYEGSSNSAKEFIPSMLNTMYGVGCTLWAACEHPLESASVAWDNVYAFAEASWDMTVSSVEYCKTLDKEKIREIYSQLSEKTICLLEQFENLPMEERGLLIGTIIGECGTDYFIATTTCGAGTYAKYAKGADKLKNANRLCNLQKISNSPYASNQVKTAALTQKLARDNYLKNVKVHWDSQNKHIPGTHQYINEVKKNANKGIINLTKEELTECVVNNAGKGQCVTPKVPPLAAGYRERVDFGKVIGKYSDEMGNLEDTTIGLLHYRVEGVHVIPARPKIE